MADSYNCCRWCKNYDKESGCIYLADKLGTNLDFVFEDGYIHEMLLESNINMDDVRYINDRIENILRGSLEAKLNVNINSFCCNEFE
ncbi:hypothetical protein [Peptostreptococcus sp. D1]|uniref:hypothetical protein n=1 Tax=Peptostreptococcus sp. D1 TaxID=72304 RepID=UPI0008EA0801|nr:hypothetical protein [Peptostreptococcus sp. D1]SFE84391.1 hypothetical protein SAMN02910278_01856 [Peptostreptococcus sp. D1]